MCCILSKIRISSYIVLYLFVKGGYRMKIEDELKALIIKHSGSVNRFASEIGVAQSTIASVFSRGVNKANINTINKICKALHISADELSNGRIAPAYEPDYQVLISSEFYDIYESLDDAQKEKLLNLAKAIKEGLI